MSTGLPAMTIHRYLKWNKDTNNFGVNEFHKSSENLIIVDEMSMIDVNLFNALLKGIKSNVMLIMVGDVFQLPSVGPRKYSKMHNRIRKNYSNKTPYLPVFLQEASRNLKGNLKK